MTTTSAAVRAASSPAARSPSPLRVDRGPAQATGNVPDDRWTARRSTAALVPFALVDAALHVLLIARVRRASPAAGHRPGRGARRRPPRRRRAPRCSPLCELALIPIADAPTRPPRAVCRAGFGVGIAAGRRGACWPPARPRCGRAWTLAPRRAAGLRPARPRRDPAPAHQRALARRRALRLGYCSSGPPSQPTGRAAGMA